MRYIQLAVVIAGSWTGDATASLGYLDGNQLYALRQSSQPAEQQQCFGYIKGGL